jgi:hypothetical protein
MTSVRAQLLRYPAALRIIGRRGRTSPLWLDVVASLIEVLERAGFSARGRDRHERVVASPTNNRLARSGGF